MVRVNAFERRYLLQAAAAGRFIEMECCRKSLEDLNLDHATLPDLIGDCKASVGIETIRTLHDRL